MPVSILHRKDTPIDGSAPMLLEGYGAYGYAFEAHFSSSRFSLVDRGFVYAIAHIRGGTDKGWSWYIDGKLEKKQNSFHDFIACARTLAAQKYTREGAIVALGGSAGGMLMGAVANMAPELFAGIIADVPFVDVLNTMLDDTLPLTPPEWLEWGNPIKDPDAFHRIRSYSPYDNVKRAEISRDPHRGGAHRSARDLLGAGQMGGAAARLHDGRRADPAAHQHEGGPRRRLGPLRPAEGNRRRIRVRDLGGAGAAGARAASCSPRKTPAANAAGRRSHASAGAKRARKRPAASEGA